MSKTVIDDIRYDPDTGFMWWKKTGKGRKVDTPIGTVGSQGYRNVTLAGKQYKAHHVVWFIHHGFWPEELDHINRDKDDNRIENLRLADRSLQNHNRAMPPPSSGMVGANWNKRKQKYKSAIRVGGLNKHLGYFNCPTAAHLAYTREKQHVC
jgi:hypothetical protein